MKYTMIFSLKSPRLFTYLFNIHTITEQKAYRKKSIKQVFYDHMHESHLNWIQGFLASVAGNKGVNNKDDPKSGQS